MQWFRRHAGLRFEDRYFHDTVARAAKRPFNLAFYRDTSIEVLQAVAEATPGIPPSGLLFHLSRCGSTLVSNAFASRDDTLVLAEPGPLNDALVVPGLSDAARRALVRSVLSVLARPQRREQRACVIKVDAWHVRSFGAIEAACPGAPWLFLHRDPAGSARVTSARSQLHDVGAQRARDARHDRSGCGAGTSRGALRASA